MYCVLPELFGNRVTSGLVVSIFVLFWLMLLLLRSEAQQNLKHGKSRL